MQLVIKIDKEDWKDINNLHFIREDLKFKIGKAIMSGTLLPNGHGSIYDENDIRKGIKNPYQCQTVLHGLELVEPIIESDKESEKE